ncbi:MAG: hypothetical protein DWC07_01640 [Candidatus Poseidoniales archaeon]|nr:MAG: hypothetical protein DWC07_01640 [Candidatus Poseidoniales archaeon]
MTNTDLRNDDKVSPNGRVIEGGTVPSRMSTANQAFGYCLVHASNSASMPSGGTPWRTLAMNPHPSGQWRSSSVQ